ncbi:hypothetical protein A2U01_0057573 [Trifolium medium]|uniref:Uncharacterized protein n=1 Tax=Trifolium medium TaxID=97028 RepID=A0A392RKM7_9FABA|nr:hypothetical protein [Trifolium medium]
MKGSSTTSASGKFNRRLCNFDGASINVDEAEISIGGTIPAKQ